MNKQSLTNVKSKIKKHIPEIVAVTAAVIGAIVTITLIKKDEQETFYVAPDGVNILVLENIGNNVFNDLDTGTHYEVSAISFPA